MPDLSDEDRREVLGEVLSDQLQAILEYVQEVPAVTEDVRNLQQDMRDVQNRLIVLKAVAIGQEKDLQEIKTSTQTLIRLAKAHSRDMKLLQQQLA